MRLRLAQLSRVIFIGIVSSVLTACLATLPESTSTLLGKMSSSSNTVSTSNGAVQTQSKPEDKADVPVITPDVVGTWKDVKTGLMWQICPIGSTLRVNENDITKKCSYPSEGGDFTFDQSVAQAIKNNLGNYSDWRVPTSNEYNTLQKLKKENECIKEVFLIGENGFWAIDNTGAHDRAHAVGQNYQRDWKIKDKYVCGRFVVPSGSANAFTQFKIIKRRVMLVRGGSPSSDWMGATSSNAVQSIIASEKANNAARTAVVAKLASSTPSMHPLLDKEPKRITTAISIEDGTLKELDWYVAGLKAIEVKNPNLKNDFANYLNKKYLFRHDLKFNSPFDKEEFDQKLANEKSQFINNLFKHENNSLPSSFTSFTLLKLQDYDFTKEVLTVSTCKDLGMNNQFQMGLRCGGSGIDLPYGGLEGQIQSLGNQGELVSSGKIKFVKFSTFINGDNTGAPLYILSRGFPGDIKFSLPKAKAKLIYDLAKTTKLRQEYMNEYGGKILSAKIMYGKPQISGFSASNSVDKGWFFTQTGGAAIGYKIQPQAICIFDGAGETPVHCQNL